VVNLRYRADRNNQGQVSRALADSRQNPKSIFRGFSGVSGENTCDVSEVARWMSSEHITETNQANGV